MTSSGGNLIWCLGLNPKMQKAMKMTTSGTKATVMA